MNRAIYTSWMLPPVGHLPLAALCWDNLVCIHPVWDRDDWNAGKCWWYDTELIDFDDACPGFLVPLKQFPAAVAEYKLLVSEKLNAYFAHALWGNIDGSLSEELKQHLNEYNLLDGPRMTEPAWSDFLRNSGLGVPSIDFARLAEMSLGAPTAFALMATNQPAHVAADGTRYPEIYYPRHFLERTRIIAADALVEALQCDRVDDASQSAERQNVMGALDSAVATTVLKAYVPSNLDELPFSRIAELRSEMATARLKYQRDIHALVIEVASISSQHDAERFTKHATDLAQERINATRNIYTHAKLDIAVKLMGISALPPAFFSVLSSKLQLGLFEPIAIAAGMGLAIAAQLKALDKARDERAKTGWSYMLDLRKALKTPPAGSGERTVVLGESPS